MREDFTLLESRLGNIHLIFGLSVDIELAKVVAGSTTLRDKPFVFLVLCICTPCQMNEGALFFQAVLLSVLSASVHDVDDPRYPKLN